jgi:hypothetical protein
MTCGKKHIPDATVAHAPPHSRHPPATHSVKKGTKLDKALVHASLATTSIYVDLAREVMDEERRRCRRMRDKSKTSPVIRATLVATEAMDRLHNTRLKEATSMRSGNGSRASIMI